MFDNCLLGLPTDTVIHFRFWDDDCVIYNQMTAETHLINEIGAVIFKLLSEKAATRTELRQNLNHEFDLDIEFDTEGFFDNLILNYQKLGLLEVIENSPA
jgi:PqqD family protein of HPr-rel-A system